MTFQTRVEDGDDRNWCFVFVIQGVPIVFTTDGAGVPDDVLDLAGYGAGAEFTRHRGVVDFKVSKKSIDLDAMRMVGGSLEITLGDVPSEGALSALFAPRSRRRTYVNDNATAISDVSIDADGDAAGDLDDPGVVYIGGETIAYSSIDATGGAGGSPLLVGGRGAFGSEARAHFGGVDAGAGVFSVPPSWIGRRVKMIAYLVDSTLTPRTSGSLARVLDTFRIERAPRFAGNGQWVVECSHLSDEVAERKLGTNLKEVAVTGVAIDALAGTFNIEVEDVSQFVVGDETTFLRAEFDDDSVAIWPILSASGSSGAGSVSVDISRQLVTGANSSAAVMKTARHIAFLQDGNLGRSVAKALTSRVGDAANGVDDVLPGRARVAFAEDEWRFGAGIDEGEVDVDAFVDIGAGALATWSFVIDEETTVEELLADFCLATGSFWLVDPDGLLTVRRLSEERTEEAATIGAGELVSGADPVVEYAEDSIWPRVSLQCNYDAASRAFEGTIELRDSELAERYENDDRRLDLKSKAIVVDDATGHIPSGGASGTLGRPSSTVSEVQNSILRRVQVATGRGRGIVRCRCRLSVLLANLGDVVILTANVPDLEGSDRIVGRVCRVIGWVPSFAGVRGVDFDLEILETLFHVAPAAVIASAAGNVLTLRLNGPELGDGFNATPGRMFAETWSLRIYDVSAGTFVDRVVAGGGIADTTVTLTAAAPAVEANVDFVTVAPQDQNSGNASENTAEMTPDEFLYTMEHDLEDAAPVTRWR